MATGTACSSFASASIPLDIGKWPLFSLLSPEFLASVKFACVFGNSGNEALVVTKDDDVYSLGSNCSGCLGLGKSYFDSEMAFPETASGI